MNVKNIYIAIIILLQSVVKGYFLKPPVNIFAWYPKSFTLSSIFYKIGGFMRFFLFTLSIWLLLLLPTAVFSSHPVNVPLVRTRDAFPNLTFNDPVDIASAGNGRLFIVERDGIIRVVNNDPAATTAPVFLDIRSRVSAGGETGLLGLAFHPNYAQNGFFYVNYTHDQDGTLVTRIARFRVSGNPNAADPNSELILLTVTQPFGNHNAGDLAFGPDGYLYVPLGDGGSGGDPDNRAQNLNDLLGKILRLDVDRSSSGNNYAIPADNPFVGQDGRDEIWAYGVRNPWRISFDRQTGDLYTADVGQNAWEEVSLQPADSPGGENYGWRLKEGTHCFNPGSNCDPGGLTEPIHEYAHANGRCSITGGFVYRGQQFPTLQGWYLFADFCSGELFGLAPGTHSPVRFAATGGRITTFGEDDSGELLFATLSGTIHRVYVLDLPHQLYLPVVQK